MRKNIYDIIETGEEHERLNQVYSLFMIVCIALSLIPLCFKETTPLFQMLDRVTVTVFIIDYLLRLITADQKYDSGIVSFIRYPFSFMAIVDLLSILPSLTIVNQAFKTLRVLRVARMTRVLRAAKTVRIARTVRYSRSADILLRVIVRSKESLLVLSALAAAYVFSTALIIFNVEPQTFDSFFEAIYWATVSLTTVGYGDIYTVTITGRIISMLSSFAGIAIVALPSGVITAGFVEELRKEAERESE